MPQQTAYAAAFGRLLIALIFIISGLGKVANPAMTQAYIASVGWPAPLVAYLVSVIIEVGGGVLLVVGFRARAVAVVLAVFTVAAAAIFHRNFGDQNQMIHFLKNIAMAGGLLQVFAFGAGAFSLDGRRASKLEGLR